MEKSYEVKPVGIKYVCDRCNEGEMQVSGSIMLMTNPPKFPHKCNICSFEKNFTVKYPYIAYKTVE